MLPLTHLLSEEIVKHTIRMMKEQNFDFIVAPYEADAQLALECQKGRAQLIFSEDSDHLTYLAAAGVWSNNIPLLLTKMDDEGNCVAVDLNDVVSKIKGKGSKSFGAKLLMMMADEEDDVDDDVGSSLTSSSSSSIYSRHSVGARGFIQMCVLAGCDYCPSIKGVGIVTAQNFALNKRGANVDQRLSKNCFTNIEFI